MSTIEVRVPQLPESVADATLVAWRKQPGDAVTRDENLADLETDKVVLEVPAPASGVLKEIKVQTGATVTRRRPARGDRGRRGCRLRPRRRRQAAAARRQPPLQRRRRQAKRDKLAPSVRRLVEEHKLEPASIPGSGRDGRITKADVLDAPGREGSAAPAGPARSRRLPPRRRACGRRRPVSVPSVACR